MGFMPRRRRRQLAGSVETHQEAAKRYLPSLRRTYDAMIDAVKQKQCRIAFDELRQLHELRGKIDREIHWQASSATQWKVSSVAEDIKKTTDTTIKNALSQFLLDCRIEKK